MNIPIAATSDVPAGKMIGVNKNGKDILVANVNGTYYAIGNVCTHMGCNLSDGILTREKVECPCHGSIFDVRTGAVVQGPALYPEQSFKLTVENGQILISM